MVERERAKILTIDKEGNYLLLLLLLLLLYPRLGVLADAAGEEGHDDNNGSRNHSNCATYLLSWESLETA